MSNPKSIGKEKRRKIFFAKGMCLVMILSMSIILIYNYALDNIKASQENAITSLQEEIFERIYTYTLELQKQSYSQAKSVSKTVENHMRNGTDLIQLKKDMDNGNFNQELHDIFKVSISGLSLNGIDNGRNGMFITSTEGILEDSYYKRTINKDKRDWESEISNSFNSKLQKYAIDKLLDHSNSLIITEPMNLLDRSDDNYNNHKLIEDCSYNTLKNMYFDEGINGFRNYQIIVPAYITDNGDIFGQEDISYGGIQNKTHKIIVIQEFNLYDQITKNYPDLKDTSNIEYLSKEHQQNLTLFYMIGLFWVGATLIIIIYFSNQYNMYIEKNKLDDSDYDDHMTYKEE